MFPTLTRRDKYIIDKIIDVIDIKPKELKKATAIWLDDEMDSDEVIEKLLRGKVSRLKEVFGNSLGCISYHYGATKIVFQMDLLPVVIKIPLSYEYLTGCINDNYLEDEVCFCEMLRDDDEEELLNVFAEIKFYKRKRLINYYLQGVVETSTAYANIETSKEARNYISNEKRNIVNRCFEREWLAKIYDIHGESFLNKFTKYLENNRQISYVDNLLGDMHGLNYGYDVEGRPIIFDYAGFNS